MRTSVQSRGIAYESSICRETSSHVIKTSPEDFHSQTATNEMQRMHVPLSECSRKLSHHMDTSYILYKDRFYDGQNKNTQYMYNQSINMCCVTGLWYVISYAKQIYISLKKKKKSTPIVLGCELEMTWIELAFAAVVPLIYNIYIFLNLGNELQVCAFCIYSITQYLRNLYTHKRYSIACAVCRMELSGNCCHVFYIDRLIIIAFYTVTVMLPFKVRKLKKKVPNRPFHDIKKTKQGDWFTNETVRLLIVNY